MRCYCCNRSLSDYESVLRHPETLEFLDICTKCLQDIPIKPIEPVNKVNEVVDDDEEDFSLNIDTDEDEE